MIPALARRGLARWQAWSTRSNTRRIFAAMAVVGFATVAVRLVVVGRELVAAREFGVGDVMDAFFIAYMIPLFAIGVIGASFSAALIPVYADLRDREGEGRANALVASVTVWSAIVLAAVAAVAAVLFPYALPVLARGFAPEKRDLTVSLFRVLLPVIVVTGVASVWTAALNAGHRFALGAIVPVVSPAVTIVLILAAADAWGAYSIAIGVVVGACVEIALLALTLTRRGVPVLQVRPRLDPDTRAVLRQYVPTSIGASVMGTTLVVDQAMAATLGAGSVAALNYGQRIVSFFLGVAAMAVATAVLPYFSAMVADRDWTGLRRTFRFYVGLIAAGSVPLVLTLWFLSETLVATLFEGGSFTAEDTPLVAEIQRLFALQVPFYLASILVVRLISSLRANTILIWASSFNLVVNIVLNLLFMRWIGVAGIALSTSCVYAGSFVFVRIALARRLRRAEAAGGPTAAPPPRANGG